MTKDEALKLALETLEYAGPSWIDARQPAITAIKEALAQPEQEPVAWGVFEGNLHDMFFTEAEAFEMARLKGTHAEVKPLYTTRPQAREPLTDEQFQAIRNRLSRQGGWEGDGWDLALKEAIEAAHGIKEEV